VESIGHKMRYVKLILKPLACAEPGFGALFFFLFHDTYSDLSFTEDITVHINCPFLSLIFSLAQHLSSSVA